MTQIEPIENQNEMTGLRTNAQPNQKPAFKGCRYWTTAFRERPMDQRFAIVGGTVSLIAMVVIGAFLSGRIEDAVVRNSAISAAVYMESFIAPLSQELSNDEVLSDETSRHLSIILNETPVADRIVSVKIWKRGGLIAYSSTPDLIGKSFPPSEGLIEAWDGHIVADFDDLADVEDAREKATGIPLLEVYNPIHSILTGEVIAVAEFYQDARELKGDLASARESSWAVVATVFSFTFLTLFGIVRAGRQTIDRQHNQLIERINEITRVSRQNEELRSRVQAASQRATAINERFLKRVGAELHDGPAQALALANLRIGTLRSMATTPATQNEVRLIHEALEGALTDIRGLSRGLILPELEGLPVSSVIGKAVDAHQARTRSEVQASRSHAEDPAVHLSTAHAICIFRFVQEGLMNAYRHANGIGQAVTWGIADDVLEVSVIDGGPGFDIARLSGSDHIGLRALRDRVESVGGTFTIHSSPGRGTCLVMQLSLEDQT